MGRAPADRGLFPAPDLQGRDCFRGPRGGRVHPRRRDRRATGSDRRSSDDELHAGARMVLPTSRRAPRAGASAADPPGACPADRRRPAVAGAALHRSRPGAQPVRTSRGDGARRLRRALCRHPAPPRLRPALQPVSALLAVIAPALHALATELPARAPQGHNIVGAQIAIGSLFSLHILIARLVSGAAELGPAIEFLGYVRQRRNYDRLAPGMGRFITYYFTVSSPIALLLITVLLVGYWGHFWTTLVTITSWPLFIEAWTFVLQLTLAYLWYYTWEPMRAFKGVHMAIGGLLAIPSFLHAYMIHLVASDRLTPSNPQKPLRIACDPLYTPPTD